MSRLIEMTRHYEKALYRQSPTRRECIKAAAFCLRQVS